MTNLIIYDRVSDNRDLCIKIIKKFFYSKNDYYKIYEYDKYNMELHNEVNSIEGTRIYLINIDGIAASGLAFARKIRSDGDLISPIILLTSNERSTYVDQLKNILFLDLIKIDDSFIHNLTLSLRDAHKIISRNSVYTFSIFDEVYRIPYKDIYYIVKNQNDDSVNIYTKDDSYLHYITVKSLEKILEHDIRFFKVHRSCIINIYNVSSYDRKNNKLTFNNGTAIDLVARKYKTKLADKLKDYSNDN